MIQKTTYLSYNPKLKERAKFLRNNSTKGEIILWTFLRRDQMKGYDFHRQKPIDNYIVDFYCAELNLIIELDGSSHYGKETYDKERNNFLKSLNLKILHFSEGEVRHNIEYVMDILMGYIENFETRTPPYTPLEGGLITNKSL